VVCIQAFADVQTRHRAEARSASPPCCVPSPKRTPFEVLMHHTRWHVYPEQPRFQATTAGWIYQAEGCFVLHVHAPSVSLAKHPMQPCHRVSMGAGHASSLRRTRHGIWQSFTTSLRSCCTESRFGLVCRRGLSRPISSRNRVSELARTPEQLVAHTRTARKRQSRDVRLGSVRASVTCQTCLPHSAWMSLVWPRSAWALSQHQQQARSSAL
jgi:hypothetical protein